MRFPHVSSPSTRAMFSFPQAHPSPPLNLCTNTGVFFSLLIVFPPDNGPSMSLSLVPVFRLSLKAAFLPRTKRQTEPDPWGSRVPPILFLIHGQRLFTTSISVKFPQRTSDLKTFFLPTKPLCLPTFHRLTQRWWYACGFSSNPYCRAPQQTGFFHASSPHCSSCTTRPPFFRTLLHLTGVSILGSVYARPEKPGSVRRYPFLRIDLLSLGFCFHVCFTPLWPSFFFEGVLAISPVPPDVWCARTRPQAPAVVQDGVAVPFFPTSGCGASATPRPYKFLTPPYSPADNFASAAIPPTSHPCRFLCHPLGSRHELPRTRLHSPSRNFFSGSLFPSPPTMFSLIVSCCFYPFPPLTFPPIGPSSILNSIWFPIPLSPFLLTDPFCWACPPGFRPPGYQLEPEGPTRGPAIPNDSAGNECLHLNSRPSLPPGPEQR